jgi:hypothetical protein
VLAPARWLGVPWPAFLAAWTLLLLAVLRWLGGRWTLPLLFFPPVLGELWLGNVNLLIGAAIVIGFRWPAAWSFVILTKLTTGIGLVWCLVRALRARRRWWPFIRLPAPPMHSASSLRAFATAFR